MTKKDLGKKGEEIAKRYLEDRGFKVIDENFRSRFGEIDLVGVDGDTLVFVEVKTRFSEKFGLPEEAVTPRKIKTIAKVGYYYKILHQNLPESLRIDVVAVDLAPDGKLRRIELISNVSG